MKIENIKVFGEDCQFHMSELYINGADIADRFSDDVVIDGEDCYAIPGLIDIHFHGCIGHDFCEGTEEAIQIIADYELSEGITSICPATMTLAEEILSKVCIAAKAHENREGAILCGINMEGPFISLAKKGAQNSDFIKKPDAAMFYRLHKLSGEMVRLVALACEEEGAMEFIDEVKNDVSVSLAHTTTDYDTAMTAFSHGAKQVTHLYNAMQPFSHRAPGLVGAACDTEDCMVEIICDGIHIHPCVIRTTFKMFGDDRICLISDSMMATGMPDGNYSLGGQPVKVKGNYATLSDGTIAGSATNLMDCMRTAVSFGIPLESAVKCATMNPAKAIGVFHKYGGLSIGKTANILLLDKDLNIKQIILRGKLVGSGR